MLEIKRTRNKFNSNIETLRIKLLDLLKETQVDQTLPDDIPLKWEMHGDLVLLPEHSFRNKIWLSYGNELWDIVAVAFKANKVARKYRVQNDKFRSPHVELLKGCDGWVMHTDNKIRYMFDVTKCMFSSGNISEKLRIAQFSCSGEIVVDLYAGIGYFTLPYLIHAKASLVHACEWNPHAVQALEKSLIINKIREKCIIHFGDNKEVCPKMVADRVNLGLIPSSEDGWYTACRALKSTGGILHIHGNVTSNLQKKIKRETKECDSENPEYSNLKIKTEWCHWSDKLCSEIKSILLDLHQFEWTVQRLNINRVKSYAPHIDHLVADIECRPTIWLSENS